MRGLRRSCHELPNGCLKRDSKDAGSISGWNVSHGGASVKPFKSILALSRLMNAVNVSRRYDSWDALSTCQQCASFTEPY